MRPVRSFLFVPADRPDRLRSASGRGCDAIIADLEDAVAPPDKELALDNVVSWLQESGGAGPPVWVRVNAPEVREPEVRALVGLPGLVGLVLPKTEKPVEILDVARLVDAAASGGDLGLSPMIESATGLVNLLALASCPRVRQIRLGELDLAADLGLEPGADDAELAYARSQVVVASRHAGLAPPAAPVSPELDDLDRFASSTRALRRLGFRGRDCIHPRQVEIANAEFTPAPDEVDAAREVLARAAREPGAFRDTNGRMVDEAVLRRARALVDEADGLTAR